MHRFYLPPAAARAPVLTLQGSEAHHALHVLRLGRGDRVQVLDGEGHILSGEITATGSRTLTLAVRLTEERPPLVPAATLYQAVAKTRSMEWIVQKAVELGVRCLAPVLSERSVPRFTPPEAAAKVRRWRELAVEALKQCGNPWLPEILPPRPLAEVLADHRRPSLAVVACLAPGTAPLRRVFTEYRAAHTAPPVEVGLWVGPEGDFTPAEYAAITATGARPVTLGPLVLRCETAAVCCLAGVRYEWAPV